MVLVKRIANLWLSSGNVTEVIKQKCHNSLILVASTVWRKERAVGGVRLTAKEQHMYDMILPILSRAMNEIWKYDILYI